MQYENSYLLQFNNQFGYNLKFSSSSANTESSAENKTVLVKNTDSFTSSTSILKDAQDEATTYLNEIFSQNEKVREYECQINPNCGIEIKVAYDVK